MSIPYSRYIIGKLPWYGALISAGVIAALLLCMREEKRRGLKEDTIIDLAFWAIPLALVGARIYYAVFNWQAFSDDPLSVFRIWEGGIAIYGAIIGGLIGVLIFSKRRKMNPFILTDIIVPGLALAQGIGRWGNYFNMEAYGREITNTSLQFFPIGVQIPVGNGYTWHMATFFYESCWDIVVFLLLWFVIRKRTEKPGTITLWYLLLYGVGRFFIEGLRTDSLMSGRIRVSQLLSLVLVVAAGALLLLHRIQHKKA